MLPMIWQKSPVGMEKNGEIVRVIYGIYSNP